MKTVSSTEAKNRLGSLIDDVAAGENAVIIKHYGQPRAVIVSTDEWSELVDARNELRRLKAWERIKELAAEVGARNTDLSPEEADAIADELGNEAKRRIVSELANR